VVIKLALFPLGFDPDLAFHFGAADHAKMPRLQVCSAGGASRHRQTIRNDLRRNAAVGKHPNRSPPQHQLAKLRRSSFHFVFGETCKFKRYKSRLHLRIFAATQTAPTEFAPDCGIAGKAGFAFKQDS
jgi:hypothetical protein